MGQRRPNLPEQTGIGIDEAGRGCLAGPVVAAAVLLPASFHLPGLADSKKLTPAQRERLAPLIRQEAVAWGIGIIWQKRIDEINILQATFEAMTNAAYGVFSRAQAGCDTLLIDGDKTIPQAALAGKWPENSSFPRQKAIIRGDASVPPISAASILAKACRDHIMQNLDKLWPDYEFGRHKGYGTAAHFRALNRFGPCPLHRLTFRGVAGAV